MQSGLYVALSSQIALEKRLSTIADNVANARTAGFRATEVKFEDLLGGLGQDSVSFVSTGKTYLSERKGEINQTQNPFDFAVQGDAWFGIETPGGQVLTKDGRFTLLGTGDLVTLEGYPVLDAGGAAIQLDPNAGPPQVGRDGAIRQNGNQVSSIGIFTYDPAGGYERFGNSGIVTGRPPEPVVDDPEAGVVQGYVEQSNVDPVMEMTRLIMVQRAFENTSAIMRQTEGTFDSAVRTLGGGQS